MVDDGLMKATDQFAVSLLQAVHAAKPGESLFLSPASAQIILSLTANGAGGETQQEMLAALGYGNLDITAVNTGNQALRGLLADPDPKVALSTANAIWHQKGMQVSPDFKAVATQQYGAQVNEVTFGDPKATKAINRWVSDQTRGRIPELVERTDPNDVMVLVNALYFKGDWQKPFDANFTYDQPFTLLDGSQRQIPFMHKEAAFGYLKAEGITGVRLPYGEGDVSFYAFMPDRWEGFVEGLTPDQYQGWMAAMGQERVFDSMQADLSGLFTEGQDQTYISQVIHKTFLVINEQGTEAAAATGVVAPASAPPDQIPKVIFDQPFLFSIRDDRTGVTLFMGAILEP